MGKIISLFSITIFCICLLCKYSVAQSQTQKLDSIQNRSWEIEEEIIQQLAREGFVVNYDDYREYDIYCRKRDSLFWSSYAYRDTIGSQQRFERALCPRLQKAVRNVLDLASRNTVSIRIFEQNDKRYCSLTPSGGQGIDGYLLYQNTTLVEVSYASGELAKLVMRPDELKEFPYNQFIPPGYFSRPIYDGPSDYYRITGQDSLEFVGRLDYWEQLP